MQLVVSILSSTIMQHHSYIFQLDKERERRGKKDGLEGKQTEAEKDLEE